MSKIPQVTINKWLKKYGYLPDVSYASHKQLDSDSNEIIQAKDKLAIFYDDPDDIETIILTPRCECPDFYDDEDIQLFGAPSLFGSGSGSWPSSGCDPLNPGIHSIRVGIDTRNASSAIKAYLNEALKIASACYAEMGLSVRYILDPKPGEKVEISKVFGGLGGSTIGWNYFHQGGCNTISGKLSSNWNPGSAVYWAGLEVHETGHGCGLRHTGGVNIMSPSIKKIVPLSFHGDSSESIMVRYFGGKPINPSPSPNPTPVPIPTPTPTPIPTPKPDDTLLERLLDAIRSFLGNCTKENGAEEVKRRIKSRGIRERIQLRNIVRQEVPPGKQKEMYDQVLAEWYQADDKEIDMLTDHMPDKFVI
jgi:hypothetical protein